MDSNFKTTSLRSAGECTGPLIIERETTLSEITDHLAGPNIDIDLDALLDACPFLPTGD